MYNFLRFYPFAYNFNGDINGFENTYNPYFVQPYYNNVPNYRAYPNFPIPNQLPPPYYNNPIYYNPNTNPNTNINPNTNPNPNTNIGLVDKNSNIELKDYGPRPFVININDATKRNNNYRTALWTGKYLQTTLMKINVGEDIGLEVHPDTDQFLRIEQGQGLAVMGNTKNNLNFQERVSDDYAIFIPAGTWHNVINTGKIPLKLYSIYAPPHHPFGTIHKTKAIAQMEEEHSH